MHDDPPLMTDPVHTSHTIAVTGRLDVTTVPLLRTRIRSAIDRAGPRIDLDLDLSGVTYCNALGLGALVAAHRRARQDGGGLRVIAPSSAVTAALANSGLDRILTVRPHRRP